MQGATFITCKLITQFGQERRSLGQDLGMIDDTTKALLKGVTWLVYHYSNFSYNLFLSFVFITNDPTITSVCLVCLYSCFVAYFVCWTVKISLHTDTDYTLWQLWKIPTAAVEDTTVYCVTMYSLWLLECVIMVYDWKHIM